MIKRDVGVDRLTFNIVRNTDHSGFGNFRMRHQRRLNLCRPQAVTAVLIGRSPQMQQLRKMILNVADTGADVLIYGETGCGKEVVARMLHHWSTRRQGQFVALNCAGLPETLFESEIFGHEAGAFTGAVKKRIGKIEHANGGTLFLDEIEGMPSGMQVKLLRVLQERTIERLGANQLIPRFLLCFFQYFVIDVAELHLTVAEN